MSRMGFTKYEEYEIVASAKTLEKYIWYNYCKQCVEDSGIREDEDFDYEECSEQKCPLFLTKEVLCDIIKENETYKKKGNEDMDNIYYEITENIGTISEYQTGWKKELNLVKWNGANEPKFDIRDWNPDHDHMSRGITLHKEEAHALYSLLRDYFE